MFDFLTPEQKDVMLQIITQSADYSIFVQTLRQNHKEIQLKIIQNIDTVPLREVFENPSKYGLCQAESVLDQDGLYSELYLEEIENQGIPLEILEDLDFGGVR